MKVHFTHEIIDDLKKSANVNFFRQILDHTLDNDGNFKKDADDHRYKGIEDAWIRYISKGKTAFRVIYLKKGNLIYLYRAGSHQVEERLGPPSDLEKSIPLDTVQIRGPLQREAVDLGLLLKTREPQYLRNTIRQMTFLGHFYIVLISPFVSLELLNSRAIFGRFLNKAVEEDTEVTLVTSPPEPVDLVRYRDLENRGIFVYFLNSLHVKLYLFDVNPETLNKYHRGITKTAILGSSNLTRVGFALEDEQANHELCYKLPEEQYHYAFDYAQRLIRQSMSYKKYEVRVMRTIKKEGNG